VFFFFFKKVTKGGVENVHWLPMSTLLEDLRRHVPRCSTRRGESMVLFLVHDATKSKVRNEQVCVVLRCAEEQVLRLQVTVDYAVVVQVGDGREDGSDYVCCVKFGVVSFPTDAVEEFTS